MSCLALGRCDGNGALAEQLSDGLCFATVADDGAGGVSIDVANLLGVNAAIAEAELERTSGACHVGRRNVVAVAREAPAYDFCNDVCTTLDCVLVAFQDDCCAATAWNQSVAAGIEGTTGFLWLVLTNGEGLNAIEGSDTVHVVLLCTAADHAVLQAL